MLELPFSILGRRGWFGTLRMLNATSDSITQHEFYYLFRRGRTRRPVAPAPAGTPAINLHLQRNQRALLFYPPLLRNQFGFFSVKDFSAATDPPPEPRERIRYVILLFSRPSRVKLKLKAICAKAFSPFQDLLSGACQQPSSPGQRRRDLTFSFPHLSGFVQLPFLPPPDSP